MTTRTKWNLLIILIGIIIAIIFFSACTTVKEVSTHSEETVTLKPITVAVPPVEGKFEIPFIRIDSTKEGAENIYQITDQVVETKDPLTGKKSKATVDLKLTFKRSKPGEKEKPPTVEANVKVQQEPIKTEAKEVSRKETTDSETKTISIGTYITYFFIGLLVLAGILALLWFKNLLPPGIMNSISKLWRKK